MSAPLTTREALAAALVEVCTPPMGDRRNPQTIAWGERCADALLASGALTDARAIAADELRAAAEDYSAAYSRASAIGMREVYDFLYARAAALSAQSERAEVER